MRIVLTGGGTAGHINPAIALAEELVARGHEVFFAGTPQGTEAQLVPELGIPFKAFRAKGFVRTRPWTIITSYALILRSTAQAQKWLSDIGADVVVGFGSYASLPACRAAIKLGLPLVLHEQNSVMGMSNKDLVKHAERVCLAYPHAAENINISPEKLCITGNPVRKSVLDVTKESGRAYFEIPQDATVLLVFGGSLGARHINQAICAMKDEILAREGVYVLHITGPKELEATTDALGLTPEEQTRWHLFGYQDHMGEVYAAADMIVSRAGASSLAEISALGIPAVLVPYPYATADHQRHNAEFLVSAGCAKVVDDAGLDSQMFSELVCWLLDDPSERARMRTCAKEQDAAHAATRLADVVINAAK